MVHAQTIFLVPMKRCLMAACCLDECGNCGGAAMPQVCLHCRRCQPGEWLPSRMVLLVLLLMLRSLLMQAMPKHRQTMLFTATITPPLEALQQKILKDPFVLKLLSGLTTASNLKEQYILVPAKVKEVFLLHVLGRLEEFSVRSAIIFCAKKHTCELVGGLLHQLECTAVTLHGDKKQKARLAALHKV